MVVDGVPYVRQKQEEPKDTCAPTCLCMAHGFRFPEGPAYSHDQMVAEMEGAGLYTPEAGTRPQDAFTQAVSLNLCPRWLAMEQMEAEIEAVIMAQGIVFAVVDLVVLEHQPISYYGGFHAVLIVGLDAQTVYLLDPDDPELPEDAVRKVERARFFNTWREMLDPGAEDYAQAAFCIPAQEQTARK